MALYDWKYYIESRTNMIQVRVGNIKLQDKQHIYDFIKANSNDKYDLSSPKQATQEVNVNCITDQDCITV